MTQTRSNPLLLSLALTADRRAPRRAHQIADDLPRRLDFSRPDPLGLADAPALSRQGPAVEGELARFCGMAGLCLLPGMSLAVQAALADRLRPGDDVILDAGLPPGYDAAVRSLGARPLRCPPASVPAVERRLSRLTREGGRGRRFVCVPGLSELSSQIADLGDLIPLCAAYAATLIVDVSGDLGLLGPGGRGVAECQGRLGQCDVLIGNLAPAFGVTAAMVATRKPLPPPRSQCLTPENAAALALALDRAESDEGRARRQRLHGNALRLRNHLMAGGVESLGQPSHVVPVPLPPGRAGQMAALMASAGPRVPLIAAPRVGRHHPRWLVRLSSDHSPADIDNLADIIVDITRAVRLQA